MTTYFVRKSGSDASAGTSAGAAKLTIQAAVNLATTAGDIVYVGAGSYRETVTLAASGSAGNVISIIGDYAGTLTGDAGVVRITGSNNDQTATRSNCVVGSSKNYVSITGFTFDLASSHTMTLASCTNITVSKCSFNGTSTSGGLGLIYSSGAGQSAVVVDRCDMFGLSAYGVLFDHSVAVDNTAHVVKNCTINIFGTGGAGTAIYSGRIGGITVQNCHLSGNIACINQGAALSVGQTITVNNCILHASLYGLFATSTAFIVENYNAFSSVSTARSNVTAGANSNTYPFLPDTRPWHSMVNGDSLVSEMDLASYSPLVELNSGTGAPSTDMRGASQTGSYREWGPLEYNSALSVSGGSALGLPIVGSAIVRGDA